MIGKDVQNFIAQTRSFLEMRQKNAAFKGMGKSLFSKTPTEVGKRVLPVGTATAGVAAGEALPGDNPGTSTALGSLGYLMGTGRVPREALRSLLVRTAEKRKHKAHMSNKDNYGVTMDSMDALKDLANRSLGPRNAGEAVQNTLEGTAKHIRRTAGSQAPKAGGVKDQLYRALVNKGLVNTKGVDAKKLGPDNIHVPAEVGKNLNTSVGELVAKAEKSVTNPGMADKAVDFAHKARVNPTGAMADAAAATGGAVKNNAGKLALLGGGGYATNEILNKLNNPEHQAIFDEAVSGTDENAYRLASAPEVSGGSGSSVEEPVGTDWGSKLSQKGQEIYGKIKDFAGTTGGAATLGGGGGAALAYLVDKIMSRKPKTKEEESKQKTRRLITSLLGGLAGAATGAGISHFARQKQASEEGDYKTLLKLEIQKEARSLSDSELERKVMLLEYSEKTAAMKDKLFGVMLATRDLSLAF